MDTLEVQNLIWKISRYLISEEQKIATAESCTGGYVAHEFTNRKGSSEWFTGGVVSYSLSSKIDILGVCPQTLKKGAVQKEVALSMAEGVKSLLKADWSLSITGYLDLDTSPERRRVYIGVVGPEIRSFSTAVVEGLSRKSLKYHSLLFSLKFLISKLSSKGGPL